MKEFIFSKVASIQSVPCYSPAQVIFNDFESVEQLFCRTLSVLGYTTRQIVIRENEKTKEKHIYML